MCRLSILLLIVFSSSLAAGDHWPGWRGPTGMGRTDEKNLPLSWNGRSGENILWKAPLFPSDKVRRDQNQSSPIVWRGRVIVTVSYWPEGVSEKEYPEHHVLCFSTRDGKPLWDAVVAPGPWKLTDLRGGYTAPTPACDGTRVYAVFGSAVLAAVALDNGKLVWRQEIKPHFFDVAIGASPVVHEGTVIFVADQLKDKKSSAIYAFDAATGATRWKVDRPEVDWAHSTPALARIGAATQMLIATANGPQGLDPADGKRLWWCNFPGRVGDTVTPILAGDLLYVDSGRGGPAVAVDPRGSGDVTKSHVRWQVKNVPEGFSSPVVVDNRLYRLHSPGILVVYDLTNGKEVFRERLDGLDAAPSPIVTPDGKIYCASSGTSYVIQAGAKPSVLARNDLADPSRASAAVAAGRIYFKGGRFLYCVAAK